MYRIGQAEIDELARVIASRQLFRVGDPAAGHLQEVERFEREWASLIGVEHALLMAGGGTAALVCALAGMGIGPGDEVLVPAYTWMATATSVLTVGAIPVLVDIDESLGIDPVAMEAAVSPQTRAVIPVHMLGRPADMEPILAIARRHGLKVLEDSCQMDGGSYRGQRTGSWGDAGAFSFNFYKIISAGEGGCLVTNDRAIFENAFVFHDSGAAFRPSAGDLSVPIYVAQQYRADELMGAVMRMQLQRLDGILADLRRNQRRIIDRLHGVDGLCVAPSNDPEGDCGVVVALQFDTPQQAQRFADAVGVPGYLGINHGKHVYTNWEPLREHRIMHHPRMNPFRFDENRGLRMDYSDGVCARTLQILSRTFFIQVDPDWTDEDASGVAARCLSALPA